MGYAVKQDKIEHYLCCPFTRYLLHDKFGLPVNSASKQFLLFVADSLMEHPHKVTMLAITCYSVMRATNHFRKCPPSSSDVVKDFLEEASKSATSGHSASQMVLRTAMASQFGHNATKLETNERSSGRRTGTSAACVSSLAQSSHGYLFR